MNPALIDGDKRIGWVAARVFLALAAVSPRGVDVDRAEECVIPVAGGSVSGIGDIAREMRAWHP